MIYIDFYAPILSGIYWIIDHKPYFLSRYIRYVAKLKLAFLFILRIQKTSKKLFLYNKIVNEYKIIVIFFF